MVAIMEKINGKWIALEHFDSEEDRKKAMNDWRRRYYEIFRSDDQFCNWLKLPWNEKPVTPKYLKEYERQQALIEEFYKYKGVYDGCPEYHRFHGNDGKYHEIFYEEYRKINAQRRRETDEFLRKIRGSNVTTGHTPAKRQPNRSITNNPPRRKTIYRD